MVPSKKLTVDRVIWRLIFWAIIEELHYRSDVCRPNANMLKLPIWCVTLCCRLFCALSHFSMCFYVWINSCNKLNLLVNHRISLVFGRMRKIRAARCGMNKNAERRWLVHTPDHVTATITELTSWQHQMLTLASSLLCSDFTCERGICYGSASVCSRPIHLLLSQTGIPQKWMIGSPHFA